MIWIQGGVSFLLWIAYGWVQSRRSHSIREFVVKMPRGSRGLVGASLILIGAMVLIGGLAIVLQTGGFTPNGLTTPAWLMVTILGLAFVHAQTMATAMLVSLAQQNVTNLKPTTSINCPGGDRTQP